jgi:hypothetical protein
LVWFYDPANKQKAIELLLAHLSIDRREAEETYDYSVSHRLFDWTAWSDEIPRGIG